MFELFLYLCFTTSNLQYKCEVIKGDEFYNNVTSIIDKYDDTSSKRIYDNFYDLVPYGDPNRKECEAKGLMILKANEVLSLDVDELDFVCIEVDNLNSEFKANLHFAK